MNTDSFRHKPDPATAAWLAAMPQVILLMLADVAAERRGVVSDQTAALLTAELLRRKGTERPVRQVLASQRN